MLASSVRVPYNPSTLNSPPTEVSLTTAKSTVAPSGSLPRRLPVIIRELPSSVTALFVGTLSEGFSSTSVT